MFSERMRSDLDQVGGRAYIRGDVVHWLAKYGLYQAYGDGSGVSQQDLNPTIAAMYEIWRDDPATFVRKLVDVVLPAGGWPVYGAHKMVHEILGDYQDERYVELFKAAMRFCRARKVALVPYELDLLWKVERTSRGPNP